MDEIQILKRRLERERNARKQAEAILEQKALELFHANEQLRKLNEDLEQKVEERTTQLTHSEEKYRGIIESMELGLMEVDLNQNIVKAYDWFCDMTGYNPGELEGKNAADVFLNAEGIAFMKKQDEIRQKGQAGVYEIQIKKKNGDLIWVLISGAPVFDFKGDVVGSIGIHYDITVRKKMLHELARAKKTAEAARDAEKQFLARMSHEIRTPLNAIIGMSHLLSETATSLEQIDYVSSIKTSADLLLKIVSDILDISKIEAGEIQVNSEPFNLRALVMSLQKTFQVKAEENGVKVLMNVDDKITNLVIGDELLLTQILMNLMSNAVKFTAEGSVKINVQLLEKRDEKYFLEIDVTDTGVGIGKEKLDLIFENFKQADDQVRHKFGGTGLGLAITKKFVELQDGKIWVESELGQGTSFKFTITYLDSGKEEVIEIEKDEQALQSVFEPSEEQVLIVEDNYMNRKYITTLMKKWQVNFEVAVNGKEAWEKTQQNIYDLIFMDISMPEMDGHQVTKLIRSEENPNQNIPIIALTASAIISKREQALNSGMTDYLPKPFNPNQLIDLIKKYTKREILSEKTTISKMETDDDTKTEILNRPYLEKFYGGDDSHAADMFDIFLNHTVHEVPQLRPLMEAQDWEGTRQLAHKIKPNFSMVGLTQLEEKMLNIENSAAQNENVNTLLSKLVEVENILEKAIPILEKELERMTRIT